MKNLTAQIAHCYNGAKVIPPYGDPYFIQNIWCNRNLIGMTLTNEPKDFDKVDVWAKISDCQLLLTPLAKISDEDAVEVAKIIKPEWKIEDALDNNWADSFNAKIVRNLAKLYPQTAREMWDYLRSKSYDCGYGSDKSGIEAGWAIDETLNSKS